MPKTQQPTVTVTISGPQHSGKTRLAQMLSQAAEADGFAVDYYEGSELVERIPKPNGNARVVIKTVQE